MWKKKIGRSKLHLAPSDYVSLELCLDETEGGG
jgi:hypothetical protein